jgi:hypothetical protein
VVLKWFSEPGRIEFSALGEYAEGIPPDISLIQLLHLDDEDLKPFTKALLDTEDQHEDFQASLSELTQGISAFFQFQDILDVSVNEDAPVLVNRHYAYYESLVYLRESVVSWLDRNVLAALTLLRPFVELSLLHLYWYLRCRGTSYKPYYHWLDRDRDKGKPPFQNALDYVFKSLPGKERIEEVRLQKLKEVIKNSHTALCAYNHTPKIKESIAAKSGGPGNISLENFLYYLELANIVLHQVVYLFILAYPMSLFPVEKHKKWGFRRGPVGLFFDRTNYALLEAYVGSDNMTSLKQSLSSSPDVKSLMEWFDSLPTLTPDEIDAEWEGVTKDIPGFNKQNTDQLGLRLAVMKSFNRSRGWALNYIVEHPEETEIPDEIVEDLRRRLRAW